MGTMTFAAAIERALDTAMAGDERVVVFGEDVQLLRRNLLVRYGAQRVRNAPISEAAFLGTAVGAAMAGLRPVVEIMLVDFIGVSFDALLNEASKVKAFSGGDWNIPMVVRASCGGGYGDGGQHEQCLWGLMAGIPGLVVVVPSTPADAAGLMMSSIEDERPVIYLEHKLLADYWLDYLGSGNRDMVSFDVPPQGAEGSVDDPPSPVPLGRAAMRREGTHVTLISLGVSVHRCLEAAGILDGKGVSAEVIDLRSVAPLDKETLLASVRKTGKALVVDEDYLSFGLSGEIAATISETGMQVPFARVGTTHTIPYARHLEDAALPGVEKIVVATQELIAR